MGTITWPQSCCSCLAGSVSNRTVARPGRRARAHQQLQRTDLPCPQHDYASCRCFFFTYFYFSSPSSSSISESGSGLPSTRSWELCFGFLPGSLPFSTSGGPSEPGPQQARPALNHSLNESSAKLPAAWTCWAKGQEVHPAPASGPVHNRKEQDMTNIQIMLCTVGALSIVAFVWATLDARRRKGVGCGKGRNDTSSLEDSLFRPLERFSHEHMGCPQ